MHRDILLGRDFWAGLLFIGLGALAVLHSRNYPLGTLTTMGPGFFPTILGALMALCGTSMALGAIALRQTRAIARPRLRAAVAVCGSALCLALLLDRIGLPGAVFSASLVASAARRDFLRPANVVLAVVLAGFCVLVFFEVLNMPIRLLPAWWQGY